MMASIFFTDRLPGTYTSEGLRVGLTLREAAQDWVAWPGARAHSQVLPAEHNDREPLPQKQGLCQFVRMADFKMLSGF
jgi:hypothetical protein